MAGDDQDLVNNSHHSSDDSFSDDNKNVPILLSINKVKEEEEDQHHHHHHHLPSSNAEFPRICKVCNKGFSSGKALGGHSRIHAQQPKKKKKKKKQQSPLFINNNNNFTHIHILPPPPPSGTSSSMNMMKKINTCSVCGKSFPSEKSLFGHMRCHPDRNWRGIQPPPPPPHHLPTANKNSSSSTLSEDAEAAKRHNKRDEDHIDSANRPSSSSSSSSISVVVDLSQSLSSSWLSTAKRGRKSTLSKSRVGSGGCPSGLDEEEQILPDEDDVVHNLMMLAQDNSLHSSSSSGLPLSAYYQTLDHHHQITNANSASITNNNVVMPKMKMKRTLDSSSPLINYPPAAKKKLKIDQGVLFISNVNHLSSSNEIPNIPIPNIPNVPNVPIPNIPIPNVPIPIGKATQAADGKDRDDLNNNTSGGGDQQLIQSSCRMIHLKKKKKRRKLKLRDLDTFSGLDQNNNDRPTVAATPDRYKCTSCNKSFTTHQALGGHRSSHNKVFKNIPALVKDEGLLVDAECTERTHAECTQVGETEEEHDEEEAASSRLLQQGGGPYRCKVCNKTFATGQALGGHKRCHWTGPIEAPSSQVASSGEASHTGHRRIPVFDLNELPAMEDEEGVESALAQPRSTSFS